jgi:hypothetical protein
VVVPLAIAVNRPLLLLIVPVAAVLLLHVPPAGVLLSGAVEPAHIAAIPLIADGVGFIVTVMAASGPQHPAADCTRK